MPTYRIKANAGEASSNSIEELMDFLNLNWPYAVMFSDDGRRLTNPTQIHHATDDGRRVLVWARIEDSVNDSGAKAVAELTRSD